MVNVSPRRLHVPSLLALLAVVALGRPVAAQTVLSVDIDDRTDASTTEAGFERFQLDSPLVGNTTTRTFSGLSVTLSGVGTNIDDRGRATPTNNADFTQQNLLREFVFATYNANDLTSGADVQIAGLTPNAPYNVRVWSFDTGSTGNRISDWFVNGGTTPALNDYTFNGSNPPTADTQYRFDLPATANASGEILISGRRDAATIGNNTPSVFVNGLQVTLVPEPSAAATAVVGALLLAGARRRRHDRA